ncbi:hypothetical protein FZ031_14635 [Listeria monocytogenes]|uniref:hypothetical protein n=1 Tax=Listeria monocytogenes TaxID=1639 RepID=UPI0010EC9EF7|nr:hypothetical protein [Listeria monocytogenes]EAC7104600.1 hypothetical protein [Listeria monocytogenes]TYU92092.1 hypothetical protein FZ031_14635 [Listeria monocytogenes]
MGKVVFLNRVLSRIKKVSWRDITRKLINLSCVIILLLCFLFNQWIPSPIRLILLGIFSLVVFMKFWKQCKLERFMKKHILFPNDQNSKKGPRFNSDCVIEKGEVFLFQEAMNEYKNSIWRTIGFTEKAQVALDVFLDSYNNQQRNVKFRKEEEEKNSENRASLLELENVLYKKQTLAIKKHFLQEGMEVDDVRQLASNVYLVFANLSKYTVELKENKLIYLYQWNKE